MWFSLPNFACYDVTAWVSWFAFAGFGVGGAGLLGFGMAVLAMFLWDSGGALVFCLRVGFG